MSDPLRDALVDLPPVDAEAKVADMLSAYDIARPDRVANDVMARLYLGGYVLVRANDLRAALAPSSSAGLDVERLAEALFRTQRERLDGLGSHEADAACIAREYAILAAPEPQP